MGCRIHRYGPTATNLSGKDRIWPGTRIMRGKAVTNRKSPAAVMRNPSAARGIILKCCVAVMAIPQGKYKSGALTKAKIAVQPPQDVFENNRPSSHAIGSTMTE